MKKIMFPEVNFSKFDEETKNKLADIDHLAGHIKMARGCFITSDKKDFIKNKKREQLKSEFDVTILTPKEFVKETDSGNLL